MSNPLATHALLGSNRGALSPFAVRFFQTLAVKAGFAITELPETGTSRTFALHVSSARFAPYTAEHDERAHDERGESYHSESHDLSPLDRQRESAGLTSSEGAED